MSEEEYKPRQKPVLDKQTKKDLSKRNRMSHKRPSFKRQNWFRYKRLGENGADLGVFTQRCVATSSIAFLLFKLVSEDLQVSEDYIHLDLKKF